MMSIFGEKIDAELRIMDENGLEKADKSNPIKASNETVAWTEGQRDNNTQGLSS